MKFLTLHLCSPSKICNFNLHTHHFSSSLYKIVLELIRLTLSFLSDKGIRTCKESVSKTRNVPYVAI